MLSSQKLPGYRFPREVIGYAVWLYHRFTLSDQDVEELLHDVGLPETGELVPLQDSGKRRGSFINTAPKKLEAMKERHTRTTVKVRYDPETHEARIALPETLDGALFGEGDDTLEVLRGKTSRIKLPAEHLRPRRG